VYLFHTASYLLLQNKVNFLSKPEQESMLYDHNCFLFGHFMPILYNQYYDFYFSNLVEKLSIILAKQAFTKFSRDHYIFDHWSDLTFSPSAVKMG
jgi:hypothetical protein